jgi:hypothetical protein
MLVNILPGKMESSFSAMIHMPEVVRKLNRWFNVDIHLTGPDLKDYVYTATFEDESLLQILEF